MMAFVELIRDTIKGVAGWKESCEAGPPVPHSGGCPGVGCSSTRLTTLRPGAAGLVTCLEEPWSGDTAKLAGLGVLPGVRVLLVQRYPVYILQLGRTQVAIDSGLACRVRLRRD